MLFVCCVYYGVLLPVNVYYWGFLSNPFMADYSIISGDLLGHTLGEKVVHEPFSLRFLKTSQQITIKLQFFGCHSIAPRFCLRARYGTPSVCRSCISRLTAIFRDHVKHGLPCNLFLFLFAQPLLFLLTFVKVDCFLESLLVKIFLVLDFFGLPLTLLFSLLIETIHHLHFEKLFALRFAKLFIHLFCLLSLNVFLNNFLLS